MRLNTIPYVPAIIQIATVLKNIQKIEWLVTIYQQTNTLPLPSLRKQDPLGGDNCLSHSKCSYLPVSSGYLLLFTLYIGGV